MNLELVNKVGLMGKVFLVFHLCLLTFNIDAQKAAIELNEQWTVHPYFGYQYINKGRISKIIETENEDISPKVALQQLSSSQVFFTDPPEDGKTYWLQIDLANQKQDSVLLSFGLENNTRWGHIEVYQLDNLKLTSKGGSYCPFTNKTFRTNADVFKLGSGQSYLVKLKSILTNRNALAFHLLLYNPSRYFDFQNYIFPNYYHEAGGYLYGFNLIKRSLEVYCDSSNTASFNTVMSNWDNRAFVNYNQQPNPTLTYWMKFSINNQSAGRSFLIGVNSGSFWNFDSIEVFIPKDNGDLVKHTLGQKVKASQKPFGVWNDVFSVQVKREEVQEVFLKVKGFDNYFVPDFQVSHINESKFWQVISWIKFIYGFFVGLIIVQFLYYSIRFFIEREPLHLYFSLFVLGIGLWVNFFSTDLQFTPLPVYTEFNIPLASFGMAIAIIFIYAYQTRYLTLSQYRFPFIRVFWVLSIINTLLCVNYAYSFTSFASVYPLRSGYLQLVILSMLVNYLFITFVGVYTIFKQNKLGTRFTLAFIPLLLGIIIRFVLALILILQGGTYNQFLLYLLVYGHYVLMAGIAFALIMMAINTAVRINELKTDKWEADKLKEISEFKSKFYANITHEFRTPLTAILGTSETLTDKHKGDVVRRNSQKLLSLVNDLLDISKVDAPNIDINWIHSDIVKYIDHLIQYQLPNIEQKGLHFKFIKDVDAVFMDFDEGKIDKIISNLLSNAINFTPKSGFITCKLSQTSTDLSVEISDTGIGIDPKELKSIFNRYYRVRKIKTPGNGLGLALAKELTEYLGGKLEVTSKVDEGSLFTLTLPIRSNHQEDDTNKSDPTINGEQGFDEFTYPEKQDFSESYTVLVVEDNNDLLELIVAPLKGHYKIITAPNGEEGFKKALNYIPDVILTDVMMPHMNGFEFCNKLKTHTVTDHIPVIMLTAKVDKTSKLSGLSHGADAYIAKPFNKKEVLLTIHNFLELQKKLQTKFAKESEESTSPQTIAPFLSKVNAIILEHLSNEKFATESLSSMLFMSRSQVFRKVKALSGMSPQLYIRSVRLKEARRLLKESDRTVSEIAYACGFSDPSYFSKVFNDHYSVSPSQIRK